MNSMCGQCRKTIIKGRETRRFNKTDCGHIFCKPGRCPRGNVDIGSRCPQPTCKQIITELETVTLDETDELLEVLHDMGSNVRFLVETWIKLSGRFSEEELSDSDRDLVEKFRADGRELGFLLFDRQHAIENGTWRHNRTFAANAAKINGYLGKLEKDFEDIYEMIEDYENEFLSKLLENFQDQMINSRPFRASYGHA